MINEGLLAQHVFTLHKLVFTRNKRQQSCNGRLLDDISTPHHTALHAVRSEVCLSSATGLNVKANNYYLKKTNLTLKLLIFICPTKTAIFMTFSIGKQLQT